MNDVWYPRIQKVINVNTFLLSAIRYTSQNLLFRWNIEITSNPAELTLPDEGDEGAVGMSVDGGDVIDDVITT